MAQTELKAKRKKGKYGYVDEKENWIVKPVFQVAWDFKEGYGRVKLSPRNEGKYGFLKPDGTYLSERQFDGARDFKDGFAAVKIGKKWTFLNTEGSLIIEPLFDKAWDFKGGKALVKQGKDFHFLLTDGSFKEPTGFEEKITKCCSLQNKDNEGWSFLDVTEIKGNWQFRSWARQMDENQNWYEHKEPEDGELLELLRYTDKVAENKPFSEWVNSLNLKTPEEAGEMLWANVWQLLMDTTLDQKQGKYVAPLRDIAVLLQLYNQLKVIERLGLTNHKENLNFQDIDSAYLDSNTVKEMGVRLCERNMLFEEDGFIDLDFEEFLKKSRDVGEYEHMTDLELFDGEI